MRTKTSAFTLIEMLVVISIIAIIAAFAVPTLTQALSKGQMTGTMNNVRQLYLAGQQMALDGATNSDANYAWPGDYTGTAAVNTLEDYCGKLVTNGYLNQGDLQKLLNAPGANCNVTSSADANGVAKVTLTGKSGLKVYKIKEVDSSNTLFAVTSNYVYNTALKTTDAPYGDKGFVVMHKGGDAGILRKNQATAANFGGDATGVNKFQSTVGKMSGDDDGTLKNSDQSMALTNPQS